LIAIEVEVRRAGEIDNREHRAERLLETRDVARLGVRAKELLVALSLNLDEVRHLGDFVDVSENLADTPLLVLRPAGGPARCVDRFGGHVLPCATRGRTEALPQVFSGVGRNCDWSADPAALSNADGPCAVRTLSRRGREKPRTHETVRRSRLFVGFARYSHFSRLEKGSDWVPFN